MKSRIRPLGLVLFVVSLCIPSSAFAWGCKGHQTVALIGEKHLTPAAKKLAHDALQLDPQRSNTGTPCGTQGLDEFAAAATWADGVRDPNVDAGWHFVDIPRGGGADLIDGICSKSASCIIAALKKQMDVLKNPASVDKDRAAAIRYIIHFACDIHQPLHCTTNGDRGGNCVPLTYFKKTPRIEKDRNKNPIPDTYAPELHGIWDKEMVEGHMKAKGFATAQAYADWLDTNFAAEISALSTEPISFEDWAMDSHQHAEDIAYGDLPKLIPVDQNAGVDVKKCSDNLRIGNRMLHKHISVGQQYLDDASDVIDERLMMAGIRLAMILNAIAAS